MEQNNKKKKNRFKTNMLKIIKKSLKSLVSIYKFLKEHYSYIIDLFMIFILLIFQLLINNKVIKIDEEKTYNVPFDLVLILLPAIITILSVSLSLTKEKIYGLTIGEISKFREKGLFSFLHMIIIMSMCILCYTFFNFLNVNYYLRICLDCIAFIYGIIFCVQDIPFLVQDGNTIKGILKNYYNSTNNYNRFLAQKNNDNFVKLLQNQVLAEGVSVTYNFLKKRSNTNYNSNLFDTLFSYQNQYFWDFDKDINILNKNYGAEYQNIDIVKAINAGYNNVIQVLEENTFDYEKAFKEDKTYHLTRTIYVLHKICNNLSLSDKEKDKLEEIASIFIKKNLSREKNKKVISFVNMMSILTVKEGETWFIEILRDNNIFPSSLFSLEYIPFGLFISMFIYHLQGNNLLKTEPKITDFLKKPTQGLNHDGSSWNDLVSQMLERTKSNQLANSIFELLYLFESIPSTYYYVREEGAMRVYDCGFDFNKNNILDIWLEIIIFNRYPRVDLNDLDNTIKKFDEDLNDIFVRLLSNKWFVNGEISTDYSAKFFDFYNIKKSLPNKEVLNYLKNYRNDYLKENLEKKIEKDSDPIDSNDLKMSIKNIFEDTVEKNEFYDPNLDLTEIPKKYYSWWIERGDSENYIRTYLTELSHSLIYTFYQCIQSQIKPIKITDYKISDKDFELLKKFNPKYKSSSSFGFIYNDNDVHEFCNSIQSINTNTLPPNCFVKENAIKLNAELDMENTVVRKLTDAELENIINTDYEMVNGLYRYSEYKNDNIRSFFISREELKSILKDRVRYVVIVFKYLVVVDAKKCKWFKNHND